MLNVKAPYLTHVAYGAAIKTALKCVGLIAVVVAALPDLAPLINRQTDVSRTCSSVG